MRKIKILKNKENESQNNIIKNDILSSNEDKIENILDNNLVHILSNKEIEISQNDKIFFRYNNNSCWLNCFLFVYKYLIFSNSNYSNDFQKLFQINPLKNF